MADLIDRQAFRKALLIGAGYLDEDTLLTAVNVLDCAPTIEAESVRHASWEYIADCGEGNCYGHCSNCKTQHKASNPTALKMEYRYCRYCGAKMDGGDAECP